MPAPGSSPQPSRAPARRRWPGLSRDKAGTPFSLRLEVSGTRRSQQASSSVGVLASSRQPGFCVAGQMLRCVIFRQIRYRHHALGYLPRRGLSSRENVRPSSADGGQTSPLTATEKQLRCYCYEYIRFLILSRCAGNAAHGSDQRTKPAPLRRHHRRR